MKTEFLKKEIWLLATLGAFQRAGIYSPLVTDQEKRNFKYMLRGYIDNVLLPRYENIVDDAVHIENIERLSEFSRDFAGILNDRGLNFGVSQKLLNLYLKYLWCLNEVAIPPHFPVDSLIQKAIKVSNPIPWTKMNTSDDYIRIIEHAKSILESHDLKSVAELELKLFNRN